MNRPSVDPAFTFGVSLAISLVLWFPTLKGAMNGSIEITDAGIRYFIALAIVWCGTFAICSLVAMYASKPRSSNPPQLSPPNAPVSAPVPARRDGDAVPTEPVSESADSNAA